MPVHFHYEGYVLILVHCTTFCMKTRGSIFLFFFLLRLVGAACTEKTSKRNNEIKTPYSDGH